jgi:hypothetical protein
LSKFDNPRPIPISIQWSRSRIRFLLATLIEIRYGTYEIKKIRKTIPFTPPDQSKYRNWHRSNKKIPWTVRRVSTVLLRKYQEFL